MHLRYCTFSLVVAAARDSSEGLIASVGVVGAVIFTSNLLLLGFFFFFFFILIKFTKTNNYNTKAKGAWKYITTLRPTLNMETQILQQVTRY